MRNLRGTYVHRGDRDRRHRRVRAGLLLMGFAASVGFVVRDSGPAEAKAEAPRFPVVIGSEAMRLRTELDAARGELGSRERAARSVAQDLWLFVHVPRCSRSGDVDLRHSAGRGHRAGVGVPTRPRRERIQRTCDQSGRRDRPHAAHAAYRALSFRRTSRRMASTIATPTFASGSATCGRSCVSTRATCSSPCWCTTVVQQAVESSREQGLDPSNGYERVVMKGYKGRGVID